MLRHRLIATTLALAAVGAQAAGQAKTLTGKEIRHRLVGKVIGDGAHWRYYLKPNGAIDGEEINRPRKGRWHLEGNRLCIVIVDGAQPDECWEVTEGGGKLMFGTYGEVTYFVKVRPPPL
ncbi:MAG TPA: hypothetical protein VJS38_02045 [Phenylobacterium sp.]|uniref:hypothetical protein n=1 Tax=Phenylobacterium sp. TaxID=1871053 RepID=UPI002B48214D|nr:hypothetical protein [Phenylobacterium sp.]HKR86931.1 hypothetical protein [Phenylobacterium sp.]